jgi:DNA-binding GntR family transcriptional regulator
VFVAIRSVQSQSRFQIDFSNYRTVKKDVVAYLKQAIIAGDLRPGERLVEPLLAEQLKVSRTPVREAIFQLENEGLVERIPYRGAVVASISSRDVSEIYTIKSAIEGLAARLACQNVTPLQIKQLRDLLKQMEAYAKKGDLDQYTGVSRSFHLQIVEIADNRWLLDVYRRLDPPIHGLRILALSLPGRPKNSVREHRAILEAIAGEDGEEAEVLTQQHVKKAGEILARNFVERGR